MLATLLAAVVPTLLATLLLGLPAAARADAGRTPRPEVVIDQPGQCVEPVERILREHPDLLRHQRDLTVREGVRGSRVSLRACVNCHADRTTGSVLGGPRAFCQACHEYAGVKPDCFECHSPQRDAPPMAAREPEAQSGAKGHP